MTVAAILLAVLAVTLAEPVSRWLARARWPHRDPRAALVLWQAVGLAAGLATIGAALVYALAPLGATLPAGLVALGRNTARLRPFDHLDGWHTVALLVAVALTARLAGVLLVAGVRTVRDRRRHRRWVDLLGTPSEHLGGAVVLDHPTALAYCLPGLRPRVVVSAGALSLLEADQLDGVLDHERAHLAARHDLVVLPFVAWRAALPFVAGVRRAGAAVATLVEMLADDRAVRHCGPVPLATAIARVGGAQAPSGGLPFAGSQLVARVERLLDPPTPVPPALRLTVYATAVALVGIPTALLLLPGLGLL